MVMPSKHGADDLDAQARAERLRAIFVVLGIIIAAVLLFFGGRATNRAEDQAVAEAGAKFTLAQQVAAACAAKSGADDLGGICQSANQIVKAGPAGSTGAQGVQGIQGNEGSAGIPGGQGPLGPKGEQGVAGLQGIAGLLGQPGLTGAIGAAGTAGADSTLRGPDGPQGPAGVDGQAGPIGVAGAAGVDGKTPTALSCTKPPVVLPAEPGASDTWACTVTAWTP